MPLASCSTPPFPFFSFSFLGANSTTVRPTDAAGCAAFEVWTSHPNDAVAKCPLNAGTDNHTASDTASVHAKAGALYGTDLLHIFTLPRIDASATDGKRIADTFFSWGITALGCRRDSVNASVFLPPCGCRRHECDHLSHRMHSAQHHTRWPHNRKLGASSTQALTCSAHAERSAQMVCS